MPFKLGPDEERRRLLEREVKRMTALFPRMGVKNTPDEFAELLQTRPFVQEAVREGKVIYEA